MRRSLCLTAVLVVLTGQASAADFKRDLMIGGAPPAPKQTYKPQPDYDWGGLYGGVQAGFGSADVDMQNMSERSANSTFRNSEYSSLLATTANAIRGTLSDQKPQFGVYAGHNWVEEDLVVGVELEYVNFGSLKGSRSDAQARRETIDPGPPVLNRVAQVESSNKAVFKDALIAKARFGQSYDRWLPYGFIGGGAVRADLTSKNTVTVAETSDGIAQMQSSEAATIRRNRPVPALAAGLGVEYALADNIIARGEYMYLGMYDMSGAKGYINSLRAGVAAKF